MSWKASAEVDAPILKNNIVNSLDFSMAGRMTSYSTSGLVETWKLGATSQVNDDIKLRTTWSVDIRAPQLNDLFNPGTINTSRPDAIPRPRPPFRSSVITTGNPNLVPEVARTISGGVVLTPTFIPGLSLSADWYSINLTGEITTIATATILDQCNPTLPSPIYPGQNGNPNDPLCAASGVQRPGRGAVRRSTSAQSTSPARPRRAWTCRPTTPWISGKARWPGPATANYNDENTITQPGSGANDVAGVAAAIGNRRAGPKWRGCSRPPTPPGLIPSRSRAAGSAPA